MEYEVFSLSSFATNAVLLYSGTEAYIVDPAGRSEMIVKFLQEKGLGLKGILLTHGHFDHIGAVDGLVRKTGAKVYVSAEDAPMLSSEELNLSSKTGLAVKIQAPILYLKEGDELDLGGEKIEVAALPGHTAGGLGYLADGLAVCGDTLFYGSIGRTDFPGGNVDKLIKAISEKLFCLPEEVTVIPGHGALTTIGREKRHNPFFGGI